MRARVIISESGTVSIYCLSRFILVRIPIQCTHCFFGGGFFWWKLVKAPPFPAPVSLSPASPNFLGQAGSVLTYQSLMIYDHNTVPATVPQKIVWAGQGSIMIMRRSLMRQRV